MIGRTDWLTDLYGMRVDYVVSFRQLNKCPFPTVKFICHHGAPKDQTKVCQQRDLLRDIFLNEGEGDDMSTRSSRVKTLTVRCFNLSVGRDQCLDSSLGGRKEKR